ncbi:MAG: type VI secretion system-associated FHA domain protein TagH [Acidobacteriota bacterium]|nr:type VI secretion system-associated FHA domain protein TagH [Acidobacteriota bacterium]
MFLTLEIVDPPADIEKEPSKVFDAAGGTIGRRASNTWTLPDSRVSGRHATVVLQQGVFSIVDTSMNGVKFGVSRKRLELGRPQSLQSGDVIGIGPYVIRVSVTPDAKVSGNDATRVTPPAQHQVVSRPPAAATGAPREGGGEAPVVAVGVKSSASPVEPLSRAAEGRNIGDPVGETDLAAVLAALGLDVVPATPDVAHDIGRILRVVVAGLVDLLRARQFFKAEFQMEQTLLLPKGNNLLKFAADEEQVLRVLFGKADDGYRESVDAFEDAFGSLRKHHLAALAGMRAAFEATLAAVDPTRLEDEFGRKLGKGGLLRFWRKKRLWDLYRDRAIKMEQDPETVFRTLFGRSYAKAYEKELERL